MAFACYVQQRNSLRATSRSVPGFSVAISRASKTATPFRRSRLLKSWHGRWKFRSTNFSTTAKNHPSSRIFRNGRAQTISPGEAKGKTRECWAASAGYWVASKNPTAGCCFTWLRKSPNALIGSGPDDIAWGSKGKDARVLGRFRRLLGRIEEPDRRLLLYMAQKMANR